MTDYIKQVLFLLLVAGLIFLFWWSLPNCPAKALPIPFFGRCIVTIDPLGHVP